MDKGKAGRNRRVPLWPGLAAALLAVPGGSEEPFLCDTRPDEPGMGLPKASPSEPLPRVRVYSGVLKAYVFRVEYQDVPSNVSVETIETNNTTINNFYKSMSRNLFSWQFTIYPQVLKAPGTKASYDGNFSALQSWITTTVNALPVKRGTDYAVYNVTFPRLDNIGFSGRSSGGTNGQNYLNGSYGTGVTAHEMGHTVGLAHAHAIEAGSTDFFGTPGTTSQHVEYGHPFDNMGRGGASGHFNICYKYRDGWTDGEGIEVIEATRTGLYRLYAHDNPDHKGRLLGIRVPSGNTAYGYWFEYRTNNTNNRRGASVMLDGWDSDGRGRADTWFMDMTPGTTTETDGVMMPGMEFKDKWGEATFRVTAINNPGGTVVTGAEGWVEVQVTIPGTNPIAPRLAHRRGPRWNAGGTAYNLAGRAVQELTSMQVLTRRDSPTGAPALVVRP